MWELELRNAGKSSFYTWQRGTMEECLTEMLSLKEGGRLDLDAMRLTWSSGELEPELCRDPSCEVVMDGDHRHPLGRAAELASSPELELAPELPPGVVQHQHVWHEDIGMMAFRCVYDDGCPARITAEELHRAGMAATADTLNTMWEVKQQ